MSEIHIKMQNQNHDLLPDELMEFVQRDTYSLLIKGFAGLGKTTLALTILKALDVKTNFFYVSTRISPKQIFQYYPWLREFIESPKTIEIGGPSENKTGIASFEDARLDEPESLFERITNQLMDVKSPVIIIDSWDAIASFMDKEARLNNERVLQTWRERAGAKLIFISEHPTDTTLDFLVDGIVELKQKNYENTKVREISLLKLRGVRITRSSYIYTLNNSIFRSYDPYNPMDLQNLTSNGKKAMFRVGEEMEGQPSGFAVSGHSNLDSILGRGFTEKDIVLLELDSHVNTKVAMAFLGKIASNFISSGNPVLFQPFDWAEPHTVLQFFDLSSRPSSQQQQQQQQQQRQQKQKNLFKILWPSATKDKDMPEQVVAVQKAGSTQGSKSSNNIQKSLVDMRKKYPSKQLLNIVGTDIIHKFYKPDEARDATESLLSLSRENADLTIVVVRHTNSLLEYLSEVCDIHLKIVTIDGTLFLQSILPSSNLFAITFQDYDGSSSLVLDPVV